MHPASPADYQPRLSRSGTLVRLGCMLLISAVTWSWVTPVQYDHGIAFVLADALLGLAGFVLVHHRRRAPLAIAVLLNVLGIFSAAVTGPAALATVSVATRRLWREFIPVGVLVVVCATLFQTVRPVPDHGGPIWIVLLTNLLAGVAQIGWGLYIGSRRELVWTLEQRARRLEHEQELREDRARSGERARIAREMHDVLAHRISQVSMHSGALAFRDDLDTQEMREHATVIQQAARAAMIDLRSVLGVLRDEPSGEPMDRPQPTYADVPLLVDEARSTGMEVDYHDHVRDEVPDALGRTAYRIVQEGITNVRKHAPGARLTVELGGAPERGLTVSLHNPLLPGTPEPPESGLGLVGLTERATLRGGRLTHGRDGDRFWVKGWIPWTA